jgi:hypothetical protein
MIHTDRQLAKTREQVDKLLASIADDARVSADIDPLIVEASRLGVIEQARGSSMRRSRSTSCSSKVRWAFRT